MTHAPFYFVIYLNIFTFGNIFIVLTYLGWSDGIGLGPGSVLLFKVSGSIISGANLGGLI
jgi:hypothetical protein